MYRLETSAGPKSSTTRNFHVNEGPLAGLNLLDVLFWGMELEPVRRKMAYGATRTCQDACPSAS